MNKLKIAAIIKSYFAEKAPMSYLLAGVIILFVNTAIAGVNSCFDLINLGPLSVEILTVRDSFKERPFYKKESPLSENQIKSVLDFASTLEAKDLEKVKIGYLLTRLENSLKPNEFQSLLEKIININQNSSNGNFVRAKSYFDKSTNQEAVLNEFQLKLLSSTGLLSENFDANSNWVRDPLLAQSIGKQSRSIIRKELGVDVVRDFSWLKTNEGEPNLERVHVARNYNSKGEPFSLEMFIFDGGQWRALYFEAEGAYWKLKDKMDKQEVSSLCLKCHISKGAGKVPAGELSPNPFFMRDKADWYRSGFRNEELVKKLLKF